MDFETIIKSNLEKLRMHNGAFFMTFGVKLSAYFDNILGFDVIKFDDDFLCVPDDVSMRDFIIKNYGQDAAKLIEKLLS